MSRPVPAKPIRVRGAVLGGAVPLICVPLVGKSRPEVLAEVENLSRVAPDIIELRVDAWDDIEDKSAALALLAEVRGLVELPVILTCRGHWEGGLKEVSEEAKDALYSGAIEKRLADFVDKELRYGPAKLADLKNRAGKNGVSLIVSYHNFQQTPSMAFIYAQLAHQIACGADVAKAALMPQAEEDVLRVFEATLAVRRDFPDTPLITMSMGKMGQVSRIAGGLYGSDLTFAVGSAASAPGQIPVREMRGTFDLLYR